MRARALASLLVFACANSQALREPSPRYGESTAADEAPASADGTNANGVDAGASAAPEAGSANAPANKPDETARESPPRDGRRNEPKLDGLAVPGFGDAVVVVPEASEPLPLFVAAHGAGDTPEWQCEYWGAMTRGRFVVLCPRGVALVRGDDAAFYYPNHIALEREVFAALEALRGTLGGRLARAGAVYSGYSQGATMGALMILEHGADFPHLLLVEGGSGDWTLGRARRYHQTGGKSVAIVCGSPGCAARAKRSAAVLEKAGLRARAEHAEGGGHTYTGSVGERARELLEGWLRVP